MILEWCQHSGILSKLFICSFSRCRALSQTEGNIKCSLIKPDSLTKEDLPVRNTICFSTGDHVSALCFCWSESLLRNMVYGMVTEISQSSYGLKLGEINVTILHPICREHSACRTVSTYSFTICFTFGEGLGREMAIDSTHTSSDWWGRGKKLVWMMCAQGRKHSEKAQSIKQKEQDNVKHNNLCWWRPLWAGKIHLHGK